MGFKPPQGIGAPAVPAKLTDAAAFIAKANDGQNAPAEPKGAHQFALRVPRKQWKALAAYCQHYTTETREVLTYNQFINDAIDEKLAAMRAES